MDKYVIAFLGRFFRIVLVIKSCLGIFLFGNFLIISKISLGLEYVHAFVTQLIKNDNCDALQRQMSKFWNLEEVTATRHYDQEEKMCIILKIQSRGQRGSNGKFMIQLQFTKGIRNLGNSRSVAKKRFLVLENRLSKDKKLYEGLRDKEFMDKNLQLGHLEIMSGGTNTQLYFMLHHIVCRDVCLTTKICVVFNASCETDTDLSLNDV